MTPLSLIVLFLCQFSLGRPNVKSKHALTWEYLNHSPPTLMCHKFEIDWLSDNHRPGPAHQLMLLLLQSMGFKPFFQGEFVCVWEGDVDKLILSYFRHVSNLTTKSIKNQSTFLINDFFVNQLSSSIQYLDLSLALSRATLPFFGRVVST